MVIMVFIIESGDCPDEGSRRMSHSPSAESRSTPIKRGSTVRGYLFTLPDRALPGAAARSDSNFLKSLPGAIIRLWGGGPARALGPIGGA